MVIILITSQSSHGHHDNHYYSSYICGRVQDVEVSRVDEVYDVFIDTVQQLVQVRPHHLHP